MLRRNADNRVRLAVDQDVGADDGRLCTEPPFPQPVRDDDAAMVAERIRAHIENVAFPVSQDGRATRVTLSVGEVSFPRDGSNDRTLLTRAEANLREATRQGGNRVVHAEHVS